MEMDFDAARKRECCICLYDLHLSATGCPCSPDTYSCLKHAKQLCSCAWSTRFFLFRYSISELNNLVEALEGKLSAVIKCAKENLGLTFHSYVPRDRLRVPSLVGERLKQEEFKSHNMEEGRFSVRHSSFGDCLKKEVDFCEHPHDSSSDQTVSRNTSAITGEGSKSCLASDRKKVIEKSSRCQSNVIMISDDDDE